MFVIRLFNRYFQPEIKHGLIVPFKTPRIKYKKARGALERGISIGIGLPQFFSAPIP